MIKIKVLHVGQYPDDDWGDTKPGVIITAKTGHTGGLLPDMVRFMPEVYVFDNGTVEIQDGSYLVTADDACEWARGLVEIVEARLGRGTS